MVTNSYRVITADKSIITLAQAKSQLKVDDGVDYENDLIQSYIDASEEALSDYLNRCITKSNYVMELDKFETKVTFERNYENDSIEKIEYYALGDTTLTLLPSDQYKLQKSSIVECFDIKFLSMPATEKRDDAIIVTVSQGFTAPTCPKPLIQAMKLRISDFYERREDRELGDSPASNILARPYRKF